jgi:hypothetical protein
MSLAKVSLNMARSRSREYIMYYSVQDFLADAWFDSPTHSPPPPLPSAYCHSSQSSSVSPIELTDGRGGRAGWGAKSYNGEKAWSSIFHNSSLSRSTVWSSALEELIKIAESVHYIVLGSGLINIFAGAAAFVHKRTHYQRQKEIIWVSAREKGRGAICESGGSYIRTRKSGDLQSTCPL